MNVAAALFPAGSVIGYAALAGVLAGAAVAATPWGRRPLRFATTAITTALGFAAWYGALNTIHAAGFNTDAPVIAVSWADAGSGIMTFVVAALVLAPGRHARATSTPRRRHRRLAGVVATVLDIFVL